MSADERVVFKCKTYHDRLSKCCVCKSDVQNTHRVTIPCEFNDDPPGFDQSLATFDVCEGCLVWLKIHHDEHQFKAEEIVDLMDQLNRLIVGNK